MPYIPPQVVQEVKRMDLLTYLKNYEPYELVHFSGNTYTTRTHDSLKISNGKWMWWSRGIGGRSALDYLIKVKDYSFLEAVELLAGQANIQPPLSVSEQIPVEKHLLLPKENQYHTNVFSYLTGRGIDEEIVQFCIDTGRSIGGVTHRAGDILELVQHLVSHVFSADFAADCVKNPCQTQSMPADSFLVIDKIMLENPHVKRH